MPDTLSVDIFVDGANVYAVTGWETIMVSNAVAQKSELLWGESNGTVYFEVNEGDAKTVTQWQKDLERDEVEKVAEDVELEVVYADGSLFIIGDAENAPYGGFYVVSDDDKVYKVSAFMQPTDYSDDLLNVQEEESVLIENVSSGVRVPVDYEEFDEKLGEELQFALKVR